MFASTSTSDARSIAQAACVEHKILDYVKSALRVTLEWRAPTVGLPRKMSSVQFTAQSFMRHLARMIELEEQDGYMTIVREQKPHLEHRVARLERQHAQFRGWLAELAPAVASITALPDAEFQDVCRQIVELLDRVDQHDLEEIELLQDTLLCDEGGEG
jgi:hemerythrin-like domain-containing protein